MSKKTMAEHVAVLTDESSEVAGIYLDHAIQAILNRLYPALNSDEEYAGIQLPRKYESLAESIAVYLINKQGAEGESAHSENGISRTYGGSYIPEDMLKGIIPMVKVVGGSKV